MFSQGTAHSFTEIFIGFEKVNAVKEIFGEDTEAILRNLKVESTWAGGYMWVNGRNGHLMVSSQYLNNGDRTDIYLDVIHELVHVRQFMEGKELFDAHYGYTERPTELQAYRFAVKEARRIGLKDERIREYLKTEWMNDQELKKLCIAVNVRCNTGKQ
jgi:hypothetical protein